MKRDFTASDSIIIGLVTWAFVWFFSHWSKTESLREAVGIYFPDDIEDRWDDGGFGSWLNCPQCCAMIALPISIILLVIIKPLAVMIAGLGAAQLAVRQFESLRPKARWWE